MQRSTVFGVLNCTLDWIDLEGQLMFPLEIKETGIIPDLVKSSRYAWTVSWRENTVPSKEQIAEFDDYKLGS